MGIVSNALLVLSGVYLALGVIYLRFWWAQRQRRDYLAFTLCCLAVTIYSWFELCMMHSQTPQEYLFYIWWNFFVAILTSLTIAWFAYENFRGRRWLFFTYYAFRLLGVVVHLSMPNGINFREVTSVGQMTVLGETLSYPIAVPNPWMILPHLSHLLLIIFCIDASIRAWRRSERRKALIFGTSVFLYRAIASASTISILWGVVQVPYFVSFPIILVIAAMLYELNYDMHRAAMLTETLAEREARLTETLDQLQLSAAAADVGMWNRTIGEETTWVSEKAGEIWGIPSGEQPLRENIFQHVHPDDRDKILTIARKLEEGGNEFQLEYRFVSDDGSVRWIHSRGKVDTVNDSRIIRGAIVDITKLRIAEEAIHELSGKLINEQEKERARLARELHDDLSQRIALLSINLATLRSEPNDLAHLKDQIDRVISDVQDLSTDVHRISHELHPARLTQLGLETALRGFCRELSSAHPLNIEFEAQDLPRDLPQDIALCLYRVTQESLQNVIKHSGASSARVSVKFGSGEIRLSVSDNGKGFDLSRAKAKDAIGLISIDERVRAVNGMAKVNSAVGAGTRVEVLIPVTKEKRVA